MVCTQEVVYEVYDNKLKNKVCEGCSRRPGCILLHSAAATSSCFNPNRALEEK